MPDNSKESKNQTENQQKTIFSRLFSRPSRDETYFSDLKAQWVKLNAPGRVKFILGALIGLALFLGALLLAYWALASLAGII